MDDPAAPDPASAGASHRPRRRRAPRKATRDHLENVALWYLGRFAATAESVERVLMRRVRRSAAHHGTDPEAGAATVREIVARYREAGLIDDRAFAEARARTLHERGLPLRAIAMKLRAKGVGDDDIAAALDTLRDPVTGADPDLAAARRYAQRRRLGPWRRAPGRADARERDLAALARAGFSYGTARAVIEGTDGDTA